jgi:hypothetical protein
VREVQALKSAALISQNDAPEFPFRVHTRRSLKGVGVLTCTRSNTDFCIPKTLCGEPSPVSTRNRISSTRCTRGYSAVRFLFWWLFLHRRLRSRQRGSRHVPRRGQASGVAPKTADHFCRASLVFIRATQDHAFRPISRKPFGFGSERLEQRLSAPSALKRRVTTSAPPLGAGQSARKQP